MLFGASQTGRSSTRRRSSSSRRAIQLLLLLLFLPRQHRWPGPVILNLEMGATSQAVTIWWRFAEDTKTDRAHEADVDDAAVAEASRTEINIDAGRQDEMSTSSLIGQERHHQVLQQTAGFIERDVDALGGVGCLL